MASVVPYIGGSLRDVGPLYRGYPQHVQFGRNYYQVGTGLGSIFKGILRFLGPMIKSGAQAVGSELFKGGAEILDGMGEGRKFSNLYDEQKRKRAQNLKQMALDKIASGNFPQSGSGLRAIKRRFIETGPFSRNSSSVRRTPLKKKRKIAKKKTPAKKRKGVVKSKNKVTKKKKKPVGGKKKRRQTEKFISDIYN